MSMEQAQKRELVPAAIAVPIIGENAELLFADTLEEQIMHDYYSHRSNSLNNMTYNNNHNNKQNSGLSDIVSSMDLLPHEFREHVTFFLDPTKQEQREKANISIQTCICGFLDR